MNNEGLGFYLIDSIDDLTEKYTALDMDDVVLTSETNLSVAIQTAVTVATLNKCYFPVEQDFTDWLDQLFGGRNDAIAQLCREGLLRLREATVVPSENPSTAEESSVSS